MRCIVRVALYGATVAVCALPRASRAQATVPPLAEQFRPVLAAQYKAMVRGDTAALHAHFADDLVWVVGLNGTEVTKTQLLNAVAQVSAPAPRFEVDSVHATRFGDIAVVEYRRADHRQMGMGELKTSWRVLDVFARRGGQWILERHTQTWLVSPVIPISLDSAALQPFVGRYQIAPGYVDDIHWEDNQLVATASGQTAGAHLVPVSTSAFSPDGVGSLITFERDLTGRVIGYVQGYPDGSIFRARRLP